eukprot:scaffold499_cov335-Pavlova_lutheri.AAC.7
MEKEDGFLLSLPVYLGGGGRSTHARIPVGRARAKGNGGAFPREEGCGGKGRRVLEDMISILLNRQKHFSEGWFWTSGVLS